MRIKSLLYLLPMVFVFQNYNYGQNQDKAAIKGIVLDAGSDKPMEFANIVLFDMMDSSQVAGTVTDKNGSYLLEQIRSGKYYLRVSFIGYDNSFINKIEIKENRDIDLGKIFLAAKSFKVNEVVVSGVRAPITYEIDRKIINVAENFSSISGNAIDILENVPSVTVDIEGNVSLRGSGNFTVLIDGKPSVLDASEALQQIPASAIENIEIITNPSAKYDPEGTAGIINVIMKKNKNVGLSGIADINAGLKEKYGTEIIADFKSETYQANFGVDYNKRNYSNTQKLENWTSDGDIKSFYNSEGNSTRGRKSYGLRGSLSFDLGDRNSLAIGGSFGNRSMLGDSELDYSQWNSINLTPSNFLSLSNNERSGSYYALFSNFKHEYETKGHELFAEFFIRSRESDDIETTKLFDLTNIVDGKMTSETGPEIEYRAKLDYSLPLTSTSKFEAGFESEIEILDEITKLFDFDQSTQNFINNSQFSNSAEYSTREIAIYSLYSNKLGSFGFQGGLRTEYTGREIDITGKNQSFTMDKWDYFPSFHLSYEFITSHQLMTSYTRRINRPHGWELEPFKTWMDAYSVRVGNPSLLPEYIDSYELGYQTLIGSTVLSLDSYYRFTKNKIERIRSVYSENVTLQSVGNIGEDYALGTEFFVNFDPVKSWNVNMMGNLYDYKIKGIVNNQSFERNSFNWNVRFNNNIRIGNSTQLQLNLMYNSASVSTQGTREGSFSSNVAVKQELLENQLTATLQIRDLFGRSVDESTLRSSDFYQYNYSVRESPIVMLNLKFNLNNYKTKNGNDSEINDNGGED